MARWRLLLSTVVCAHYDPTQWYIVPLDHYGPTVTYCTTRPLWPYTVTYCTTRPLWPYAVTIIALYNIVQFFIYRYKSSLHWSVREDLTLGISGSKTGDTIFAKRITKVCSVACHSICHTASYCDIIIMTYDSLGPHLMGGLHLQQIFGVYIYDIV